MGGARDVTPPPQKGKSHTFQIKTADKWPHNVEEIKGGGRRLNWILRRLTVYDLNLLGIGRRRAGSGSSPRLRPHLGHPVIRGVFVKGLEVIQPTKRLNRIFFSINIFRGSLWFGGAGFRPSISFDSVNILYLICMAGSVVRVPLYQTMVYCGTGTRTLNSHLWTTRNQNMKKKVNLTSKKLTPKTYHNYIKKNTNQCSN